MLLSEAEVGLTDFQSIVRLSCGASVLCKKVPGFLLRAFQRSHVDPKPPKKPVKVLGGMTTMEEDPNDPEYKKTLDAWTAKAGFDFLEIAMDYMVLLDETVEQSLMRERRLDRYGMENVTPNRMDVFVFAEFGEDAIALYVKELCDEVMRLSTITPTEVAKAKDGFRPPVDEPADNTTEDATDAS
jgi:hypothetical protein